MFDMFITGMENENEMFDIDVEIICVSTFMKIQTNFSTYRPNTDQFLTFFWKGLCYQNYFYRPLCHHWSRNYLNGKYGLISGKIRFWDEECVSVVICNHPYFFCVAPLLFRCRWVCDSWVMNIHVVLSVNEKL